MRLLAEIGRFGRGFSEKLKTEITGVSNIDGLLLDRDFEVLSDDDLAVLKALNNEYLYYEQKQEKAVMEAIGYEIIKIRQKDIYFDQYNPGPYIDRVGYKQDERIINPDVKMESLENLLKEFPVDDLLINLVDEKLKKILKER